ncbi:hypothetical protein BDV93DRAFT_148086 [Ceratobasidium sp. AG-I]|nr:hypothetical protein BDV93DRAFT_148086 [Ceratobasidium sp. AG-I]
MGPPIQVYLTSIASAPALRQRQEHLLRILQVKKIPFTSYDLASDEDAKKLWRRKAPANNANLPGILIGGEFAGTYEQFDEAVEFGELDQFFRLKEAWGEEDEALAPTPAPQKPIGVPGVATPLQVTGQKPSYSPSPSKPHKRTPGAESIDIGSELGFGLEGLKVSQEEMLELVESLGLGGDDADDLVKGLGLSSKIPKPKFEITPAPAENTGTQDTQSEHNQGTTIVTSAPAEPVKASAAIAATSGDEPLTTSESKTDKADGTQPPPKDSVPVGAVVTPGPVQTTAANPVTETNNAEVGKPDGESNPKPVQGEIPEGASAAAPSNEITQLPSATDDGEKEVAAVPKASVAPSIPPVASPSPQTESQAEEARTA